MYTAIKNTNFKYDRKGSTTESDAEKVFQFLSDKKLWKNHIHSHLGTAMWGFPIGIETMKQYFDYNYNKASWNSSDKDLLQTLKSAVKNNFARQNENYIQRFFNPPPSDEFEVNFYNIILEAKDLKTVVDWINEVKNSGLAYQKTRKV